MSQDAVERFLGRIATDEKFRGQAKLSVSMACINEGLVVSEEEMSALKRIDFILFELISHTIDDSIKRC
jgi:hypothetical protein